jgi:sporulation protein YunB
MIFFMICHNLVLSIIHIACRGGISLKRFKKPRKGPLPFRYVMMFSLIIFILLTAQGLYLIEKGIKPTLLRVAESRVNQIATAAINDAISKQVADRIDTEELTTVSVDNEGILTTVDFDSKVMNRVLSEATIRVTNNLKRVENGELDQLGVADDIEIETKDPRTKGILYYIPLGQATNNSLLANLGPEIPVRFTPVGSVKSDMYARLTEYGINNVLVEIYVRIEVSVRVVIPFATKPAKVSTDIPVGMRIISGRVPQFYNNGGSNGTAPGLPGIIIK